MSFEEIVVYLTTKQAIIIYAVIALSAYIENIFPPYPSDTIILAGAFLAGLGDISYVHLHISATLGGLAGAMTLYYFGYTKGRLFFQKYDKSYLKIENMEKIESWFARWGNYVLIGSRFIAGARSVIAITAGVGKVPVGRMAALSLISFILWYLALIGGMYLVKSNWQKLVEVIKHFNIFLVIVCAVILIVWLVKIYRKNRIQK